ncbi:MAG: cyclic pyranopterin monophosphate synthase MoaC [Candidatus Thermoplasmatota archaeon]
MARMPDATDTPPVRRMSVVRGTLALKPATCAILRGDGAELLVAGRVAGTMAAKDAARAIPTALPVHLTDAFCDLTVEDAQVVCTMTVQAYARATLEAFALAGASGALLALLDAVKSEEQDATGNFPTARLTNLEVVQNVIA